MVEFLLIYGTLLICAGAFGACAIRAIYEWFMWNGGVCEYTGEAWEFVDNLYPGGQLYASRHPYTYRWKFLEINFPIVTRI